MSAELSSFAMRFKLNFFPSEYQSKKIFNIMYRILNITCKRRGSREKFLKDQKSILSKAIIKIKRSRADLSRVFKRRNIDKKKIF